MTSYIYFIQVEGGGPIKIGITRHDPRHRMVKIQSDCPWPVNLLGTVIGSLTDEEAFHHRLRPFNIQGEWFNPTAEVMAAVDEAIRSENAVHFAKKKRSPKHSHPLCQYRSQNGLTLQDVAALVGVKHATISRVETGRQNPSMDLAARIARATGIHLGDLRPDIYRIFYPEQAKARELARASQ